MCVSYFLILVVLLLLNGWQEVQELNSDPCISVRALLALIGGLWAGRMTSGGTHDVKYFSARFCVPSESKGVTSCEIQPSINDSHAKWMKLAATSTLPSLKQVFLFGPETVWMGGSLGSPFVNGRTFFSPFPRVKFPWLDYPTLLTDSSKCRAARQ